MQPLIQRESQGRTSYLAHSSRLDGDLSPSMVPAKALAARRQRAVAHPWCATYQVHSDRTILVGPGDANHERPVADALVTTQPNLVLAVHAGDCVPVGFLSDTTAVAVAHAGWKGLEAGVLESAVRRMRELDATSDIVAAVGPHIRASHYEFGVKDLNRLIKRFGPSIESQTEHGTPALDLTTAIAIELDRLGVQAEHWSPGCTASDADQYWSHRARQEPGRIALTAWIEDGDV